MKNHFKHAYVIIMAVLLLAACRKEEAKLTPTTFDELGFNLNQGNPSIDARIKGYFDRHGTYMLYKFEPRDAYWAVTRWDSAYRVIPADPAFVDKQLDLLDTTFFRYYADSTLRKYLPRKFLLCSSIRFNGTGAQLDGYLTTNLNTGWINETFLANWGSSRINTIRGVRDSAALFRGNINYGFLRLMDLSSKMGRSDLFAASSDYTTALINNTQAQRFKRGFLTTTGSTTPPGLSTDWIAYIQAAVQNPYSVLTNPTGMTANNTSMQGILTPVKDSSGLIRKKYDAILDYYKTTYNIDLQRIGDGSN